MTIFYRGKFTLDNENHIQEVSISQNGRMMSIDWRSTGGDESPIEFATRLFKRHGFTPVTPYKKAATSWDFWERWEVDVKSDN